MVKSSIWYYIGTVWTIKGVICGSNFSRFLGSKCTVLLVPDTFSRLHRQDATRGAKKMLKVEPNMTHLTVHTVHIFLLEPRYLLLLLVGIHISYMTQPFLRYDTTLTVRYHSARWTENNSKCFG